jgi:hypothetical protein
MGNKIVSNDSTPTDVAVAVGEIGENYKKFMKVIEEVAIDGRMLHNSSEAEISGYLDAVEFKEVGITDLTKQVMLSRFKAQRTSSNPVEPSHPEKKRTLDNAPLLKKVANPKKKKVAVVERESGNFYRNLKSLLVLIVPFFDFRWRHPTTYE